MNKDYILTKCLIITFLCGRPLSPRYPEYAPRLHLQVEYAPIGLGIRNPITDIYGHIK